MALRWFDIDIPLGGGVDTKTDPKLVRAPNCLDLENAVLTETRSFKKRSGYSELAAAAGVTARSIATRGDELLVCSGTDLFTYVAGDDSYVSRGAYEHVTVDLENAVSTAEDQTSPAGITLDNLKILCYITDSGVTYYVKDATTDAVVYVDTLSGATDYRLVKCGSVAQIYYITSTGNLNVLGFTSSLQSYTYELAAGVSSTEAFDVSVDPNVPDKCLVVFANDTATNSITLFYVTPNGTVSLDQTPVQATLQAGGTTGGIETIVALLDGTDVWVLVNPVTPGISGAYLYAFEDDLTFTYGTPSLAGSPVLFSVSLRSLSGIQALSLEKLTTAGNACRLVVTFGTSAIGGAGSDQPPITAVLDCTQGGTQTSVTSAYELVGHKLISSPTVYTRSDSSSDVESYAITLHESTLQSTYFLVRMSDGAIVARFLDGRAGGIDDYNFPVKLAQSGNTLTAYVTYNRVLDLLTPDAERDATDGFQESGVQQVTFNFNDPLAGTFSEFSGTTYLNGGFVHEYDGFSIHEQGFHVFPEGVVATTSDWSDEGAWAISTAYAVDDVVTDSSGVRYICTVAGTSAGDDSDLSGGSDSGVTWVSFNPYTYNYRVYYESTNNQGQRIRSAALVVTAETKEEISASNSVVLTVPRLWQTARSNVNAVVYRSEANADIVGGSALYRVSNPRIVSAGSTNGYLICEPQTYAINSVTSSNYRLSFTDALSDNTLLDNEPDYLSSGELVNFPGGHTQVLAAGKERVWGAYGRSVFYSKTRVPGEAIAFAAENSLPLPEASEATGEVTGIAPLNASMIVFTRRAIYAINGEGPNNFGFGTVADGRFNVQLVSLEVGCSDPGSIVQTPQGLMFKSEKGIYLLGHNYYVNYIGAPVEAYNGSTITSALVVPNENQVRFLSSDDTTLVYDHFRQQWTTFTNHRGTSAAIWQNEYVYTRTTGAVFKRTPGQYTDAGAHYNMRIRLAWVTLANPQNMMKVKRIYVLGDKKSDHTLRCNVYYNYGTSSDSVAIDPDNFISNVGYGEGTYGEGTYGGSGNGLYRVAVNPARRKCMAISLEFQDIVESPGEAYELTSVVMRVAAMTGPTKLNIDAHVATSGPSTNAKAS